MGKKGRQDAGGTAGWKPALRLDGCRRYGRLEGGGTVCFPETAKHSRIVAGRLMIHDSEFDLSWADPPPRWVEGFGPLVTLWGNPIFQRRYVIGRLEPTLGARKAFIVGLVCSLALNGFLYFVTDRQNAMELGLLVTIALPGGIAVCFTGLRLFLTCLIATPLEFRREVGEEQLGAILSTPISDSQVFFGECISGLMRGLGAIEEVIALLAGLVIPYLLLMSPIFWPIVKEAGIHAVWWAVLFGLVVIMLALLLVITSVAAGLYSVVMPVVATVPATFFHVFILVAGSMYMGNRLVDAFARLAHIQYVYILVRFLSLGVFEISAMALILAMTSHFGVLAFARARRPGYYEPERATAAGLYRRERVGEYKPFQSV